MFAMFMLILSLVIILNGKENGPTWCSQRRPTQGMPQSKHEKQGQCKPVEDSEGDHYVDDNDDDDISTRLCLSSRNKIGTQLSPDTGALARMNQLCEVLD